MAVGRGLGYCTLAARPVSTTNNKQVPTSKPFVDTMHRWSDVDKSLAAQEAASVPAAVHEARMTGDVMTHTRALRDAISASKDPKFQNSKFLSFLSKMTQGEIILEDNQVGTLGRVRCLGYCLQCTCCT